MTKPKLILDVDTGSDDAVALALAMLGGETKDSCDERYERGMQVSLEVFCEYFGIDLAQCGDAMLVAFADGDRCLQAGQMLLERDRTPDARTAPPSAQPLPPEAAACVPGSEIWHRKYGRGRIVSLQGTLAAIRFEAPGETGPRTFCLPAALQNGFLSFKADAPG